MLEASSIQIMEARRSSLTHKFSAALEEIESLQLTRRELLDRVAELERAFKHELMAHEQDLKQAKEDIDELTQENALLREHINKDRSHVRRAQSMEQDTEELAEKYRDLLEAHKKELEHQAAYEMLIGQLKTELQHKEQELSDQTKFMTAIEKGKKHISDKYNRVKKELAEVKNDLGKKADDFIKWRDEVFHREQAARMSQEEHRHLLKRVASIEAELREAIKRADKAVEQINQKNERLKTLRSVNSKLESRATEAEACVEKLMAELKEVQEAMEKMSKAKNTHEVSESTRLKEMLAKNEQRVMQLLGKIVPLIQKNEQLANVIEMKDLEIFKLKQIARMLSESKPTDSDHTNDVLNSPKLSEFMRSISPNPLNIHKRESHNKEEDSLCMTNEFFYNLMSSPYEENRPKTSSCQAVASDIVKWVQIKVLSSRI